MLGKDFFGSFLNLCRDLEIKKAELLDREVDIDNFKAQVKRAEDAGVKVFSLAPHTKILAKPNEVQEQITDGVKWLDLAASEDVKNIRVQIGDGPLPRAYPPMDDFDDEEWEDYRESMVEAVEVTMQVVKPLVEHAEKVGVTIGMETHHSYSSNYLYMDAFEKAIQSKYLGWIFDIGNYENDEMRWKGLDVIRNNVKYIHAKAYSFQTDGLETTLNFPRAAKVLNDAGFSGEWSIEFEGKMNGIVGSYRSAELVRYSIAKAKGTEYTINTKIPTEEELMKTYTIN